MIPDIEYTPAKFTALKTPEKNLGRQEPDACPPGSPPGSLCGAHDSNDVAGEMGAGRAAALPRSDEPALRWGDRDSPRGGRRPPGGLLLQLPAGPAVSQSPRVCVRVCAHAQRTHHLHELQHVGFALLGSLVQEDGDALYVPKHACQQPALAELVPVVAC